MDDEPEKDPNCTPVYFTQSGDSSCRPLLHQKPSSSSCPSANHAKENSSVAKNETTTSQEPDFSSFDIVKAVQYGAISRVKELVESGHDVNKRDAENVTLLHWAAINNRRDIVKYFLVKGAVVDAIGGDLKSTPMHWATRQGHLSMIVLLIQHGGDPSILDGEGCNCLHLAAQFGHTAIVAYLIAKGQEINAPDANGMTALMWSSFRITTSDPTRLLITLGASLNLTDQKHHNTALHWAVYSRNSTAVSLLVNHGANIFIKNAQGDTPIDMSKRFQLHWITQKLEEVARDKEISNKPIFMRIHRDKECRYWMMMAAPFLAYYALGALFHSDLNFPLKRADDISCVITLEV